MNRLLLLVKLSAFAAAAFFFVACGLAALELRHTAEKVGAVADETKAAIGETRLRIGETQKQFNLVLLQSSETMNQVRHVSMEEREFARAANLKTLDVLGK